MYFDCVKKRTTEALKRKKAEGIKLGHPKGLKNQNYKLKGKKEIIEKLLKDGYTKIYICEYLNVSNGTLFKYLKQMNIPY